MKILFWADGFWPRIGGTESQGLRFIEGMQERGHECIVLAQKDYSDWKENEIYKGISIKRFDFDAILAKQELKNMHPIKEHLDWIVEAFHPDIIYLNTFTGGSSFVFLLFRKMFHMPVIATAHAPYYWDTIPPHVKIMCSQIDHICCVSQWALNIMEKFLPSCRDKLRLIYNGLMVPDIAPEPLPFCPPVILLLGRLSFEKGFDTAIKAFSLLKKRGSDARLLIAGDGPERLSLEHLVNQLDLRDGVQFTGKVLIDDVPSVINRATCIVMPSAFEAFGLVALESMQMQRPVIASNVGGLREVVSDQETGLLVPPRDVLALCNAMDALLKCPQQMIDMGVQGRKLAIEKFSLKRTLDLYEEVFKESSLARSVL